MVSIFLSVVLGAFCGYLVYTTYSKETKYLVEGNYLYMLQYKKYNSYDSMKLANINEDYTYYEQDSNYYIVIGFTKSISNINKIKEIIDNVNIVKCYIGDKEFNNQIDIYDKEIEEAKTEEEIQEILKNMISYYNNNEVEILKIYN
jgi:hypothetical protein